MSNRRRIAPTLARRIEQTAQDEDARFFNTHPGIHTYRRPATPAELRTVHMPPGTWVIVTLTQGNKRLRGFYTPNERAN
jgi:hypothetical protein